MKCNPGDIVVVLVILVLIYMVGGQMTAGYKTLDPGLVGLQAPLPPLQIPDENPPDMSSYTQKNALNWKQTEDLLTQATLVLREKTKLCWEPIETQYATLYTDPETGSSLVKSRITFSEVKRFFARDYDVITQDGQVIYIQTEANLFDDPNAPKPYNPQDVYHKSVGTSVELLNKLNA